MATTPVIPREDWEAHPNYPSQVLLLGSHQNFLRLSDHLIAEAEGEGSLFAIAALYVRWIAAMRSHEAYEERKLYPYLRHRWGTSFQSAQQGHEELHRRDDAVRAALASEDRDAVAQALRAHDETLRAHLAVEEDLVIPLLLSLSAEEFDRYYYGRIEDLIPRA